MDLLAHALWAGVAGESLRRRGQLGPTGLSALIGLTVLPDVVQALPVAAWSLVSGRFPGLLWDFAVAHPGQEPILPDLVQALSHHLHCTGHSAIMAGLATVLALAVGWRHAVVLTGWWLHIVIDVFTHSADFYPVPVLYPLTLQGFDGLAWNTPGFQLVNYLALLLAGVGLWRSRRR